MKKQLVLNLKKIYMKTFLVDQVGIITSENIDKKLQLYADILIVLMDIKKRWI